MAYLTNRQAPNSGLANILAMKGRMGDTELVHMSKPEIDMMRRMGEISTNPKTGLPEAFNLEEEIEGLASLMNMPNAKKAMNDLMEFGKEKLKTLTMKELEQEMPKQPPMPTPKRMPPPPPQQEAMANLRSGGLVSFGEDIKKAIKENNQDIEPFLNDIERLVNYRFGVDISGGSQPTMGATTPSTNIAEPQVVDTNDMKMKNDFGVLHGKPADPTGFTKNKDGILEPTTINQSNPMSMKDAMDYYSYDGSKSLFDSPMNKPMSMPEMLTPKNIKESGFTFHSAGRRPKDYFEGHVDDSRGDGMTDSIDFKVEGDPVIKGAKLSADEYVLPADLVAMLGNGSSDAGAEKLDRFTKDMRIKAFGTPKQQKKLNATKELKEMI
jgi:hypothetical protein